MTRYAEIADALRGRIQAGEFSVGDRLPGISTLQKEYDVSGLNTIRSAQRLLVEEGLLRTQQGVGAFVVAIHPPTRPADVLALLEKARNDLTTAITALRDEAVKQSR